MRRENVNVLLYTLLTVYVHTINRFSLGTNCKAKGMASRNQSNNRIRASQRCIMTGSANNANAGTNKSVGSRSVYTKTVVK